MSDLLCPNTYASVPMDLIKVKSSGPQYISLIENKTLNILTYDH